MSETVYGWMIFLIVCVLCVVWWQRRRIASSWRRAYHCPQGKHRRQMSQDVHLGTDRPLAVICADCLAILRWLPEPSPDEVVRVQGAVRVWPGETENEVLVSGEFGEPEPFWNGQPVEVSHVR